MLVTIVVACVLMQTNLPELQVSTVRIDDDVRDPHSLFLWSKMKTK
jgi:hypothetical protein